MRLLLMLLLATTLAACGGTERDADTDASAPSSTEQSAPDTTSPADTATSDSASVQEATGTVESITGDRSYMRINHERIPGYMEAMTMSFAVSDTSLVQDIESGQRIDFTFEADGGVPEIIEVTPKP
ncbi:MAG: copper-binding protein [Longimonas sp.]|uniref:copper-binding protein n=1 Tax=Longimonas sp. TaxID=2039626 RepID=UPI003976057C